MQDLSDTVGHMTKRLYPPTRKKTATLWVRIEASTIERLKSVAIKEHRSVASIVLVAVDRYLEQVKP